MAVSRDDSVSAPLHPELVFPGSRRRLRACHECDWVVSLPPLRPHEKAECPRCGYTLARRYYRPVQRSLALATASLVALLLTVNFPFVSFEFGGLGNRIELPEAATTMLDFEQPLIAVAVALTVIVLPALYLAGVIWLQLALLRDKWPAGRRTVARSLSHLTPWMMADVFVIGALVSVIKLSSDVDVGIQPGFWTFCCFALLLLFTTQSFDPDWIWFSLEGEPLAPEGIQRGQTAASQGLAGCETCGLISRVGRDGKGICRRCGDRLQLRQAHSIQHTWALLIAAAVMYVPANLYPIMITVNLGSTLSSTIIGGIAELWEYGSWPIAVIIFVTSVIVPVAKLLVLGWLCLAVRSSAGSNQVTRTRLYRVTEIIGRWSMVDVFVVALLVALIRGDQLLAVIPGPAALSFCSVVVLTMLAAITFDPRLLWDDTPAQEQASEALAIRTPV